MVAIIIGASGATGKELVTQLIENSRYSSIITFTRKPLTVKHSKIVNHVVDFDKPEIWADWVKGDVAFSCLGTTLKAAGSKEAQKIIDYDYQYNFAKTASNNHVPHFVLVSAYGANTTSAIFYSKLKGELEEAVLALKFATTTIFQTGMLDRKNTDRLGEKLGLPAINALNKMGLFLKYRPLSTNQLAQAMVKASTTYTSGVHYLKLDKIAEFLKE